MPMLVGIQSREQQTLSMRFVLKILILLVVFTTVLVGAFVTVPLYLPALLSRLWSEQDIRVTAIQMRIPSSQALVMPILELRTNQGMVISAKTLVFHYTLADLMKGQLEAIDIEQLDIDWKKGEKKERTSVDTDDEPLKLPDPAIWVDALPLNRLVVGKGSVGGRLVIDRLELLRHPEELSFNGLLLLDEKEINITATVLDNNTFNVQITSDNNSLQFMGESTEDKVHSQGMARFDINMIRPWLKGDFEHLQGKVESILNLDFLKVANGINMQGYSTPTDVQANAIPVILEGRDVLAGAQTGTGKTAGFTLPLLQRLSASAAPIATNKGKKHKPRIRALILTPTRELASQVSDSVQAYGKYLPIRSNVVFGGVKISSQIFKLRRGADVLVATPGRLLDLVNQHVVDLSNIEILVLDEADRMLDMGFLPSIKSVLSLIPKDRQTLLFSATYSSKIAQLAGNLLRSPVNIEVAQRNTIADSIDHIVHPVEREQKRALLSFLIGDNQWQQVLVFTKTKHGADKLSKQLNADGLRSTPIHGNLTQGARKKALELFKEGRVRVLVATDVAARGLDIHQLSHVVNFELPYVAEDYIHRIGRTGRAGNKGTAISLVGADEKNLLQGIERLLNKQIKKTVIDGYEPNFSLNTYTKPRNKRAPARNGSRSGKRSSSKSWHEIRSENNVKHSHSKKTREDNQKRSQAKPAKRKTTGTSATNVKQNTKGNYHKGNRSRRGNAR
jgi:ATP-dependent RNA helicase RhlE